MGKALIVHADDFGLAPWVNDGIVEAHLQGIVSSTSLMATGQGFAQAVELAARTPSLDVGVHLTLTEERPAAPPCRVPSLLDGSGRLHRHALGLAKQLALGRIDLDQVRIELDNQIRRVTDHCERVSHLDGHQHVHMLPGISRVVQELALRHGIPCIRYPRERLARYMFNGDFGPRRLLELRLLNACCAATWPIGIAPDAFFGFYHGGRLDPSALRHIIAKLPAGSISELMCHPGRTPTSHTYDHWGYHWQQELDTLTSAAARAELEANGVTLTSYRDLVLSASRSNYTDEQIDASTARVEPSARYRATSVSK